MIQKGTHKKENDFTKVFLRKNSISSSPVTCYILCVDLVAETQFNVELVVQCLRLSSNPQTHHHAYLLLSSAATIFPVCSGCHGVCVHVVKGHQLHTSYACGVFVARFSVGIT